MVRVMISILGGEGSNVTPQSLHRLEKHIQYHLCEKRSFRVIFLGVTILIVCRSCPLSMGIVQSQVLNALGELVVRLIGKRSDSHSPGKVGVFSVDTGVVAVDCGEILVENGLAAMVLVLAGVGLLVFSHKILKER